MKNILVTGGCGYIGSHTICELSKYDYNIIVIDNLCNSSKEIIPIIEKITKKNIILYEFSIDNKVKLKDVFKNHNIEEVIHFAALKSVSESISNPLKYYKNNVTSTITLLEVMEEYNCKKLIFSSSATVYGNSQSPLNENSQIGNGITNPYGQTKYITEIILRDYCKKNNDMMIIALRYFNPIGAHESGLIGENPNGIPNNLMPYILKVSLQNNSNIFLADCYNKLKIFGNNYQTKDKTCIRDYIHVVDLAKAHIKGLLHMKKGYNVYNIGTGKGTTVLELINTFMSVNKVKVPYKFVNRREGDQEEVFCNSDKANKELSWKAVLTIENMCKDNWIYIKNKNIL